MIIITVIISIILSFFSTSVMSYVSLATPIGPWIAPTLVLLGLLFSQLYKKFSSSELAYAVSAGSIGGIVSTACAFSLPTLFFLDPATFNHWMSTPLFFIATMTALSLIAGSFGLLIANFSEETFLTTQNLSFPIGQLIHKMIATKNQLRKSYELMIGFVSTAFFCLLQTDRPYLAAQIPSTISLLPALNCGIFTLPRIIIPLETAPMICAIGFVTGHVIAAPLAIGALINMTFIHYTHSYLFSTLSSIEFTLAFCSGIVLFVTSMSLLSMPQQIIDGIKKGLNYCQNSSYTPMKSVFTKTSMSIIALLGAYTIFFSYFQLPLLAQLYLLICTIITTYQISAIAGRIGLALLGRFATFVMVPAMLIFNLNYTHIVFIATFVEISGGVATDILFGRKLAQLANISHTTMQRYQIIGLVSSSLVIGIIFWLLINHFGLGSPELCAYRAQSRQLLIQAQHFNSLVMLLGAACGLLLKKLNANPMLVLGGLLMPLNITIGLVAGGFLALLSKNKEEWYPLWSGVFASNSLYMLLKAL